MRVVSTAGTQVDLPSLTTKIPSGLELDRPLSARRRTEQTGITVAPSGVTYGSPNTREVVVASAAMLSSASGKRIPGILLSAVEVGLVEGNRDGLIDQVGFGGIGIGGDPHPPKI